MEIGNLVRFNHERDGGPVHRVVSIMADGMIEIHDMDGYFAPHLFAIADDIAAIPPDAALCKGGGHTVSPCAYCNGTGMIAIRSRDGAYAFPGPVPDDVKGYADADCWYCDCARYPEHGGPQDWPGDENAP